MNTLQQLPELAHQITMLDNKRYVFDKEIAEIQTAYEALAEAGGEDYEPQDNAERALRYLKRNTDICVALLSKANFLTRLFISDVKEIISDIERLDDS